MASRNNDMTDLEISKALALAIGWTEDRLETLLSGLLLVRVMPSYSQLDKFFDYRDWNVIGPIAVKFDCFQLVASQSGGWAARVGDARYCFADTAQKAIAMAVIGAKK